MNREYNICDEGQLCPYEDCCWNCGFSESGWYVCPNCEREFWVEDTDSDYVDFHTYYLDDGWNNTPPTKPDIIPVAHSCGPSWGTPTKEN
jgi:hypothetical protein